jgi:CDP-diacylglycerol--serine O-phosphatidyltransferase
MLANRVTFVGLNVAVLGIVIAPNDWSVSVLCLMAAGLFDLFDGVIARRTRNHDFGLGKQLDSLVDAVSFGVLPLAILRAFGGNIHLDIAVSFLYITCVVRRLAIFNTLSEEVSHFWGLPVTYVSLVFPFVLVLHELLDEEYVVWSARIVLVVLSILFTSRLRIPKPKKAAYFVYPAISAVPLAVWIFRTF